MTALLATTGDPIRMFEYTSDAPFARSSFVVRQAKSGGHHPSLKVVSPGVSSLPHILSPVLRAPNVPGSFFSITNQGAGPERWIARQFVVRREDAELRCHALFRHYMRGSGLGHVDGGDAADRAQSAARCTLSLGCKHDGHLLRRRGRVVESVWPVETRTQHDPLQDAPAKTSHPQTACPRLLRVTFNSSNLNYMGTSPHGRTESPGAPVSCAPFPHSSTLRGRQARRDRG
jgi:hypothetical protein